MKGLSKFGGLGGGGGVGGKNCRVSPAMGGTSGRSDPRTIVK